MKKDEKLVLWTERLKAFQASGQTCKEWCQEHQIPVSTMTYWNRKLRGEPLGVRYSKPGIKVL